MNENKKMDIAEKLDELEARNMKLAAEVSFMASGSYNKGAPVEDDEIDLKELWNAIWHGKWLIVLITSVFAVASIIYAVSTPNEYKSTVLLAPASQSGAGGLAKLAGQFGGLASLAGINLGSASGDDKSLIAMEIIKTWGFLEKFIEDNNIQVEVFAAKGWNRSNDSLVINAEIYDEVNRKWVRDFDLAKGETAKPSSWELYKELKDRIGVSQDKSSGLVSISVEYFSPKLAKEWADKLVSAINAHIQKQERDEATKSIEYLTKKIKETNITDMQSVFYQLIEEQTKTLMLAEVSEEYVFKTLSAAKVAEEKVKPKRVLIFVLGVMIGGILSVIFVLLRNFFKSKP